MNLSDSEEEIIFDSGSSLFDEEYDTDSLENILYEDESSDDEYVPICDISAEAKMSNLQASAAEEIATAMQKIVDTWNLSSPVKPEQGENSKLHKLQYALTQASVYEKMLVVSPSNTLTTEPSDSDDDDENADEDESSDFPSPPMPYYPSREVLRQSSQVDLIIRSAEKELSDAAETLTNAERQSLEAKHTLKKAKLAAAELQAFFDETLPCKVLFKEPSEIKLTKVQLLRKRLRLFVSLVLSFLFQFIFIPLLFSFLMPAITDFTLEQITKLLN